MRYKFTHYKIIFGEKIMTVIDFKEGRFINFDLDALQSNELDEELKSIHEDNLEDSCAEFSLWI